MAKRRCPGTIYHSRSRRSWTIAGALLYFHECLPFQNPPCSRRAAQPQWCQRLNCYVFPRVSCEPKPNKSATKIERGLARLVASPSVWSGCRRGRRVLDRIPHEAPRLHRHRSIARCHYRHFPFWRSDYFVSREPSVVPSFCFRRRGAFPEHNQPYLFPHHRGFWHRPVSSPSHLPREH